MRVVALVGDLMDRSRITAALPDVTFSDDPAATAGADVVVVDLVRFGDRLAAVRAATAAPIVAFGPHVDDASAAAARHGGADRVWPRSRFFRDPAAAVHDLGDR